MQTITIKSKGAMLKSAELLDAMGFLAELYTSAKNGEVKTGTHRAISTAKLATNISISTGELPEVLATLGAQVDETEESK